MIIKICTLSALLAMTAGMMFQTQTTTVKPVAIAERPEYVGIGKQIQIARLEKQLTQEDLAKALHLTMSQINNIEKGNVIPVKELIFNIEETLETTFSMDYMLKQDKP